jgi:hypothetical protein
MTREAPYIEKGQPSREIRITVAGQDFCSAQFSAPRKRNVRVGAFNFCSD